LPPDLERADRKLTYGQVNKTLDTLKPWDLAKQTDNPGNKALLHATIYTVAETLRVVGIHLQPYMPEKAAQLLDILGVAEDKRMLENATPCTDFDFGVPIQPLGNNLFPPLIVDG
jgi:methionyl-tRNA synthetase